MLPNTALGTCFEGFAISTVEKDNNINFTKSYLDGGKDMRVIFKISVLLSGVITLGAIWVAQHFTSKFNLDGMNEMWSNGNPALFFIIFPMPIIAYFLFSMIFVFEAIHKKYKVNRQRFIIGYTSLFIILISYTCYRIINFKKTAQPHFEYEIGYLNPYSNDLFFNVWTLLATLCISALVSFYSGGREGKKTINKVQASK